MKAMDQMELWKMLSKAIQTAARRWPENPRQRHDEATIARTFLWSGLHDRAVWWACNPGHWRTVRKPKSLPDQSTMSRRTRKPEFHRFLQEVGKALQSLFAPGSIEPLLKVFRLDGKPLAIAGHSKDPNAAFGQAVGCKARGYKFHSLWNGCVMPAQWAIAPMNVDEKVIARRFVRRLEKTAGYLLVDTHYDSTVLYGMAGAVGCQMIAPRQKPGTNIPKEHQNLWRVRGIQMLECRVPGATKFGRSLHRRRRDIEGYFGGLTSFGGGLTCLPAWVRRPWRVRNWVHAKLLINAARQLYNQARPQRVAA